MRKAALGALLVLLGVLTAVTTAVVRGLVMRGREDDWNPEPFSNAPYIAAWVVAGLLVVCGAILYAGDSTTER